jgi:ankyrin repeat protein
MRACSESNVNYIILLLEKGASLDICDNDGKNGCPIFTTTPLILYDLSNRILLSLCNVIVIVTVIIF